MAHIYRLDDHGLRLLEKARGVAQQVLSTHADRSDLEGRFPEESVKALGAAGLMGICLPTTVGGLGQPPKTFAAVVEELASACASTAMIYVMHVSASMVIASSSTFGRKDATLKAIAAGRHLTTLALSERGTRSQFWMPMSKLEPSGAGYVTNAFKSWITSASTADSYVSIAQKPGASGPLESTLYFADPRAAGVRVASRFDGLGLRGNDSAPTSIEGYHVAEEDLLTPHGEGLKGMLEVVLPWFSAGTAAMSNGLCLSAIGATRAQLVGAGFETGGMLRDLPVLRARIAEMSARTEAARALLGYTLGEMEAPSPTTPLYVLQTRLTSLEAAIEVTDLAMKACGGSAFSRHLPLERAFRDARAGWVMAPTVDHLRDFVGKALTGLPLL